MNTNPNYTPGPGIQRNAEDWSMLGGPRSHDQDVKDEQHKDHHEEPGLGILRSERFCVFVVAICETRFRETRF